MMRTLLCYLALFAGIVVTCPLRAQSRNITGTVLSAANTPLEGVSIRNKNTGQTVTTATNGVYRIAAQEGDVLEIAYIGFKTLQLAVGKSNTAYIRLESSDGQLSDVVVTAMDIKRNARELGYSVQKVAGKDIQETQRENFINALQGRVAGLTVTPTTGQAGSGSSIVLRGFNSLSLSNQPLFVVDGVIMDNQTLNQTSNGGTGIGLASDLPNRNSDYTNRMADLNPNDIASVTILKGPEATALYGSQASSGAIVITTRKPTGKGIAVTYDNSFRTQAITRFNKTIDTYNTGTNGVYNGLFQSGSGTFFGPAYPSDTRRYNNVHHFFRTGFTQLHNLGVELGGKVSSFRLSTAYLDQSGVIPNNTYEKFNIRIANTTKIGQYIDITPSLYYITNTNNKPIRGSGGYLLDLYTWPADRNVRDWQMPNGRKSTLVNGNTPNSELDNPFFSVYKNLSQDKTNRYIATLGINIHPLPWLNLAGRFGYDAYRTNGYILYHPDSYFVSQAQNGSLDNYYLKYFSYNHTLTATAHKNMGKFNGRVMLGTMWQDNETSIYALTGTNLKSPARTDSSNTDPATRIRLLRNVTGQYNQSIARLFAYFGEASVGYNNLLFFSYTQRFESASVLPKSTRSYHYPGVSASLILSDLLPGIKSGGMIDYFKLRASRASTARLPDPYSNQSVFTNNLASGGGYSYGFTNSNPNLKPERQSTYEVGTELRLLSSRINLEASYYRTKITGQIAQGYRASFATGFVLNTQNAAATRNTGIEITLGLSPVKTMQWSWEVLFNFNKMYNKVLSIPSTLTEYYLADTWLYGNARGGLMKGGATTTITGYHYLRNQKGILLVDPATGLAKTEATFSIIGDRNPSFTLGTTNTIRYKNWYLSFLWDLKVGGDVFNGTDMYLTVQGKSNRTADRMTPRIVQGVLQDGLENTDHPTRNTIVVTPYYQQTYYTQMPEEAFVQKNVNWLRLRDITLNYTFPASVVKHLKYVKAFGLFATFNDLVLLTNYSGADPSGNGNTAASKGVGGFGFDFGNLPAPVIANVGLRVSF